MSSDEIVQDAASTAADPGQKEEAAMNTDTTRKRPRLDLTADSGNRERKRGKSMFGLVLGTLNKAKIEDKERNASEAAKKRQMIEQRLQNKLRKETDSVRRAEEAKKDKTTANRKEEDLQLKDSVYKLRRKRLPVLANFLLTSDIIPDIDDPEKSSASSGNPLAPPPRSHPPPLYYLPAILTPSQEAFISKRKQEVSEAAEKEWQLFREERTVGISEIQQLRQRVAEEEENRKKEKESTTADADAEMDTREEIATNGKKPDNESMDVDDGPKAEKNKEESAPPPPQDDDDAVEY
ncbi:pinin sdk mema domain protein [Moniliophthora roreri MCA 2997]|uniref:Pinin sdk mema domain protein n=1 Tax=Moniliophthora roreri (strain MCA 2997) TaxID=1381753 RepID=V2WSW1_MONRO|nr:pinin sdk mema domain protein [Moniliophthora roreri MCA 2997]